MHRKHFSGKEVIINENKRGVKHIGHEHASLYGQMFINVASASVVGKSKWEHHLFILKHL